MSDVLDKFPELLPKRRTSLEPPKKWRNRYIAIKSFRFRGTDTIIESGTPVDGQPIWPSFEIAEQKALECMNKSIPPCPVCTGECVARLNCVDYDRPYPVE